VFNCQCSIHLLAFDKTHTNFLILGMLPLPGRLNEDMMESLFGCNPVNSAPREQTRKSVLPPVEKENRVLDPKKSQNIAILLRALNVTRDEVSEALLDGM
jgi:hypothetical protein